MFYYCFEKNVIINASLLKNTFNICSILFNNKLAKLGYA